MDVLISPNSLALYSASDPCNFGGCSCVLDSPCDYSPCPDFNPCPVEISCVCAIHINPCAIVL